MNYKIFEQLDLKGGRVRIGHIDSEGMSVSETVSMDSSRIRVETNYQSWNTGDYYVRLVYSEGGVSASDEFKVNVSSYDFITTPDISTTVTTTTTTTTVTKPTTSSTTKKTTTTTTKRTTTTTQKTTTTTSRTTTTTTRRSTTTTTRKTTNFTAPVTTTTVTTTKVSPPPPHNERRLGDVNGDGMVDAVDASLILSEYASLSTGKPRKFNKEQETAADVDENGMTDAVDASLTLAYYAYLSSGGTIADMREWRKK